MPLHDLLQSSGISYGVVQPGNDVPGGVPIIRVKDIKDGRILTSDVLRIDPEIEAKHSRTRLQGGEILLSLVGTIGEVAIAPKEVSGWNVNRAVGVLRVAADITAEWVALCLRTEQAQRHMTDRLNTTVQSTLNLREVRTTPIVLPPARERQAIVEVLGALGEKIAVNECIVARADELIRYLFIAARSEGDARELPLLDALRVTFGSPFESSGFSAEGVGRPLLRIRDLKTYAPQVWTTQSLEKELVVKPGDVVAGMDAEFRPTFWLGKPALLNQRVLHAQSRVGGGAALAREALREPLARVEGYKTGTTVAHLNKRDLSTLTVQVPSERATDGFEARAESLRGRLLAAAAESDVLAALRDTLLPQLMSGRLRVKDAEKIVEDAT
ncbi:restriction endonuclease subunit S [Streptomyces sp. MB22_4]|uniref:restriction endonuclease subunit S n=1 Tax=Streptomyces sp. MB22_4 TaxID=3383120 RepID=UPI0039A0F440